MDSEADDIKYIIKRTLTNVILLSILAVIFVNTVFKDSDKQTDKHTLDNAVRMSDYDFLTSYYEKEISENFFDLSKHRLYISSALKQVKSKDLKLENHAIYYQYQQYTHSDDPNTVDIGYYGLGFSFSQERNYQAAIDNYTKVSNHNLKYLNNSIGFCYNHLGKTQTAEQYFKLEIKNNGNLAGAYYNLLKIYKKQNQLDEICELLNTESAQKYIPVATKRICYLYQHNYTDYIKTTFLYFKNCDIYSLISSLMITIFWLIYLKKLDVFEPERNSSLLITFILGIVTATSCLFVYDIFALYFKFSLEHSILNNLTYSILCIGLIEEGTKFLTFFLVLKFTRQVNESVDYIIYPGIAALGFAFTENLSYLNSFGLNSIVTRAIMSVLLHISLSVIAVSGIIYAKYKNNGSGTIKYFILSFSLAVILHGLYDFFLINDSVRHFRILYFVILMFSVLYFGITIRNSLNHSEFYGNITCITPLNILIYGMFSIMLTQYFMVAQSSGANYANTSMLGPFVIILYLSFQIFAILGSIKIEKGKWYKIFGPHKFSISPKKQNKKDPLALPYACMAYSFWAITSLGVFLCFMAIDYCLEIAMDSVFFVSASILINILIAFILGISGCFVADILFIKKHFGIDRNEESKHRIQLIRGLSESKFKYCTVFIMSFLAIALIAGLLSINCYASVFRDKIRFSNFTQLDYTDIYWNDITEINFIKSEKLKNGQISRKYNFTITTNKGSTFNSGNIGIISDKSISRILELVEQYSNLKAIVIDPYPQMDNR